MEVVKMAKSSLIGFDRKVFKSVKFDHNKHDHIYLAENVKYVKFSYGVRPEAFRPVDGQIVKIHDKGLEVITDYGFMFPTWDKIRRIYMPKITQKQFKQSRVKCGKHNISILDAAINKLIHKAKIKTPSVKIKDDKTDLSTRYSRTTTFRVGNKKTLTLTIESMDSTYIDIDGTVIGKKSKLKLDKNHKINSMQISNTLSKIKKLVD
jgi:hypothetical protein